MKVRSATIFDIGISNIASLKNALTTINIDFTLISFWSQGDKIPKSEFYILPGVGSFDFGMNKLREKGIDKLIRILTDKNSKIVGICLGMQLFLEESEESTTNTKGLGLIPGKVEKLDNSKMKVPNIGWNIVKSNKTIANEFNDLLENDFYFIHSYYCNVEKSIQLANIYEKNGYCFPVAYKYKNIYGFQFHPEKSHNAGLALLDSFVSQR